jgi:hypothetical protein
MVDAELRSSSLLLRRPPPDTPAARLTGPPLLAAALVGVVALVRLPPCAAADAAGRSIALACSAAADSMEWTCERGEVSAEVAPGATPGMANAPAAAIATLPAAPPFVAADAASAAVRGVMEPKRKFGENAEVFDACNGERFGGGVDGDRNCWSFASHGSLVVSTMELRCGGRGDASVGVGGSRGPCTGVAVRRTRGDCGGGGIDDDADIGTFGGDGAGICSGSGFRCAYAAIVLAAAAVAAAVLLVTAAEGTAIAGCSGG